MIQVQKIRYVFRDCVAFGEKGTACPHHDCRITLNLQETLRTDLVKGTECRGTAKQGSVMFSKSTIIRQIARECLLKPTRGFSS